MSNQRQRREIDLTAAGKAVETPWGRADFAVEYGPGVVSYSTPGHGGFWVAAPIRAMMAPELRDIHTFCGQDGWYEEDCDWAIVAVAFPTLFDEFEVYTAWAMLHSYRKEAALAYEATPAGAVLKARLEAYGREHAQSFTLGSMSTGGGDWSVSAIPVGAPGPDSHPHQRRHLDPEQPWPVRGCAMLWVLLLTLRPCRA